MTRRFAVGEDEACCTRARVRGSKLAASHATTRQLAAVIVGGAARLEHFLCASRSTSAAHSKQTVQKSVNKKRAPRSCATTLDFATAILSAAPRSPRRGCERPFCRLRHVAICDSRRRCRARWRSRMDVFNGRRGLVLVG